MSVSPFKFAREVGLVGESGLDGDFSELVVAVFHRVEAPFEAAIADIGGDGLPEFGTECPCHVTGVDPDFLTEMIDVEGLQEVGVEMLFEAIKPAWNVGCGLLALVGESGSKEVENTHENIGRGGSRIAEMAFEE